MHNTKYQNNIYRLNPMLINRDYIEPSSFWVDFLESTGYPKPQSIIADETLKHSVIFNNQIRYALNILLSNADPEAGLWMAMQADMSLEKIRLSAKDKNKDITAMYLTAKEHVAKIIRSYFYDTILTN